MKSAFFTLSVSFTLTAHGSVMYMSVFNKDKSHAKLEMYFDILFTVFKKSLIILTYTHTLIMSNVEI